MEYLLLFLLCCPNATCAMFSFGQTCKKLSHSIPAITLTRKMATLSSGQRQLVVKQLLFLQVELNNEEATINQLNSIDSGAYTYDAQMAKKIPHAILISSSQNRRLQIKREIFELQFKLQE